MQRALVAQSLLYPRGDSQLLTPERLDQIASNTDATSYASNSVTPTANVPLYVAVLNVKASSPDTPTLSGCGITWSQTKTQTIITTRRLTVFEGVSASPSAGALTADFGGATQLGCAIVVISCPGAPKSGGQTIQSTSSAIGVTATTMTNSLAAFTSPKNVHLAFVGNRRQNVDNEIFPDADFTEIANVAATDGLVLEAQWARNQVDCTSTWTSADVAGTVSIEVKSRG
jgi:hypothetical protein